MRKYVPNNSVSKYYSVLFTLPNMVFLSMLLLTFNIVLFLFGQYTIIIYSFLLMTTLIVYSQLFNSVFKRLRRTMALVLVTEVSASLLSCISVIVGISFATALVTVAVLGLDGTKPYRYIVPLVPYCIVLFFIGLSIYSMVILASIPVALDYLVYMLMSTNKIDGYRAPDIGTLYLQNYLERKKNIEKLFRELSVKSVVCPRLFRANDTAIIYSDIHYGPFSNIGSSMFPTLLSSRLRKAFPEIRHVVVLHGMGSHDRNIPDSDSLNKFIGEILRVFGKDKEWLPLEYYGWFRMKKEGSWDLLFIVFDQVLLVFISNQKGIDDLPYELQEYAEELVRRVGLNDIILIDAHNHEKQAEHLDIDALKELLKKGIIHAKEIMSKTKPVPANMFAAKAETSSPGLVSSEIVMIKITRGPSPDIYLLYLPGNNMAPGLRQQIKELAYKTHNIPIDAIEVFTNDEHTHTGTNPRLTYLPVHSSPELLETVRKLLGNLKTTEKGEKIFCYKTRVKTLLMGGSAFKLLDLLRKSFWLSAGLLITYIIAVPILTWIVISAL